MITQSDNDAATDLWNEVGQSRLQHFLNLAEMDQTGSATDGYWGLTQVTAHDEMLLLRLLARPNWVLTAASRAYELGLMARVISIAAVGHPGRRARRRERAREERVAAGEQRLAHQQHRRVHREWQGLPDRGADRRQPVGAVRDRHDRGGRAGGAPGPERGQAPRQGAAGGSRRAPRLRLASRLRAVAAAASPALPAWAPLLAGSPAAACSRASHARLGCRGTPPSAACSTGRRPRSRPR